MTSIIFTAGDSWLSRTIMKLTGEPVSHVSILVGGAVAHSDLRGPHIELVGEFFARRKLIFEVPMSIPAGALLQRLAAARRARYNIPALLFLAVCFFLRRHLGIPLPKSNLWQVTGMYLCTEWVSSFLDGEADSMITPYKLYLRLKGQKP